MLSRGGLENAGWATTYREPEKRRQVLNPSTALPIWR